MESPKRLTVLITGTNKGIGLDLVKIFLKNQPKAIIYATSREQFKIASERWSQFDDRKQVKCKKLDICSTQSIQMLVKQLKQEKVKLDILINNAGVFDVKDRATQIPDLQPAKLTLDTNLKGPINLTEKLLPLLSQSCKVVNISSSCAALKLQAQEIQKRYSNPNIKLQDIYEGINDYLQSVKLRKISKWSFSSYFTSKMLLNAWSRFILQNQWLKGSQKAICVSPGFCKTPMTEGFAQQKRGYSSESGALRIYQTAFLENVESQVFYHRARKSDYYICGEGLPIDQDSWKLD